METQKETGLMRKTKKELVEIILRKDDVEIKLKDDLSKTKCKLDEANIDIHSLKEDIANLKTNSAILSDEKKVLRNELEVKDNQINQLDEIISSDRIKNKKHRNILQVIMLVEFLAIVALFVILMIK